MGQPYDRLRAAMREIGHARSVLALLGWDQETMMPRRGAPARAEQIAFMARLVHERLSHPALADRIAEAQADPDVLADSREQANVREFLRDHERAVRVPAALVEELARTSAQAVEVWRAARERSDFASFAPWLERLVELNRRRAECLGAPEGGELYDALLEEYEPGMRAREVESIFGSLREKLKALIASYARSGSPQHAALRARASIERQREFNRFVAERVGFDFAAGRFDVSTHPFTEGIAAGDTRITTRYTEEAVFEAMFSTLHEVGHALYEQGLPKAERPGEPLAQAASLGIHESQSRLWENQVGRSRAFWRWLWPHACERLAGALSAQDPEACYRAVNAVQPNLIRVESDETTYNLHIVMRFDLERALLRGELSVSDLPATWNARIREDLGLQVPDDRRGCLQDIHWSTGSIGYFPTYTLGNLYAAQLWQAAGRDLGDLDGAHARGEFFALLQWLRERVHLHGRRYTPVELLRRATGAALSPEPLLGYLEHKLQDAFAR